MGIKDLFSKKEAYTGEERKIVLVLMALRICSGMQANGLSEDDAQTKTSELLGGQDLTGDKIFESPDAMIVKIVKDYIKVISENLLIAKAQRVNIDLEHVKTFAIKQIGEHRDRLLSLTGSQSVPNNLDDFIYYRVRREIEAVLGDPEQLGFSKPTVQTMTDIVKAAYQPTISFRL